MNYFRIAKQDSPIHGSGLFAMEPIPKGNLVINWLDEGVKFVRETEHLSMIAGSDTLSKSSIRLMGNIFLYGDELGETDYINHSTRPNLIYHAGLCFSLWDIKKDDELTLDYRLLNSEFEDDVVRGYTSDRALMESAQQLIALFKTCKT